MAGRVLQHPGRVASAISGGMEVNCRGVGPPVGVLSSIEDIVLGNDFRGVAALRPHLPADFCGQAAQFALSRPGTVLIATGFYISMRGAPEADGPPGALAIGRALEAIGRRVVYVSDHYTVPILRPFVDSDTQVVDFPIADDNASSRFASELLSTLGPSLLISIERCGLSKDGTYLNMRGVDISAHTARIDHLFFQHPSSIGIGDGGNEIGMGNVARFIPQVDKLPDNPAVTTASHLIISSTSNWGGYGLVAGLSRLVGRNLLPGPEEDDLICSMIDLGAVDGIIGASQYTVDTMSIEEHRGALSGLYALLVSDGIPSQ